MDWILAIAAIILLILGVAGAVVPGLPGPILSFCGLVCAACMSTVEVAPSMLILWGLVTVALTVADYLLPAWMVQRFGGSRAGSIGATVGVVAGLFILSPVGLLLGPFVGALLGELIHDSSDTGRAVRAGIGSFLAFVVGSGVKLVASVWLMIVVLVRLFG